MPDGTGNAGNAPLLLNGCGTKAVISQLYGIYRPQRPDTLYPVQDGESLARYLVQEVQLFGEVHPDLLNHIDYAAIGRELETSENYLFTDNGIFYYR